MKYQHSSYILLLFSFLIAVSFIQCDKEPDPVPISSNTSITKLDITAEGTTYQTIISNGQIRLSQQLHQGIDQVSISTLNLASKATCNYSVGDVMNVANSPITITVTAEDGSMQSYMLTLENYVPSSLAEIKTLILKGDKEYLTSISGTEITLIEDLGFLNDYVTVKSMSVSANASADFIAGDTLYYSTPEHVLEVTAEDGSISMYRLTLSRDEGLAIQANPNISAGSSHSLQGSKNVLVEGNHLTGDYSISFYPAYADFNGDGFTDVFLSGGQFDSPDNSPVLLYLGDGTAENSDFCECGHECGNPGCNGFTKSENFLLTEFDGMNNTRKVLKGDYNGDGNMDVFIIGHGRDVDPFPGEAPAVLLNDGTGKLTARKIDELVGFHHGASSADFDNDGDLDVFITGAPSDNEAAFLINDGSGNFTVTSEYIDEGFADPGKNNYTSEFIDVNNDGFMDLLIGGHEEEGAQTLILWGNSSGKYYEELSYKLAAVVGYQTVLDIDAADLDGDGDNDIVINRTNNDYNRYFIQVIENKNNEEFEDVSSTWFPNNSGSGWFLWVYLMDLNSDNNIDIYYEAEGRFDKKFYNDGTGKFN